MAPLLSKIKVKLILVVNPKSKIDYKTEDVEYIYPLRINIYKGNRNIHKYFIDYSGEELSSGVILKVLSSDRYYAFMKKESSYLAYHKHWGVVLLDEFKRILVIVRSYPISVFEYLYTDRGYKSWITRLKML